MTITRVGSNSKYANGWEKAFGATKKKSATTAKPAVADKKSGKKATAKAAPKAATKKAATKKAAPKKAAKKK